MATPNLTGPEKAVLFLLSLDESIAAPIVAELEEHDVRKLREIASMMRAVPANSLDYVYEEYIDKAREAVAVPQGGMGYLRRLAAKALGEDKANAVVSGAAPASALDRISSSDPVAVGSVRRSSPRFCRSLSPRRARPLSPLSLMNCRFASSVVSQP